MIRRRVIVSSREGVISATTESAMTMNPGKKLFTGSLKNCEPHVARWRRLEGATYPAGVAEYSVTAASERTIPCSTAARRYGSASGVMAIAVATHAIANLGPTFDARARHSGARAIITTPARTAPKTNRYPDV